MKLRLGCFNVRCDSASSWLLTSRIWLTIPDRADFFLGSKDRVSSCGCGWTRLLLRTSCSDVMKWRRVKSRCEHCYTRHRAAAAAHSSVTRPPTLPASWPPHWHYHFHSAAVHPCEPGQSRGYSLKSCSSQSSGTEPLEISGMEFISGLDALPATEPSVLKQWRK